MTTTPTAQHTPGPWNVVDTSDDRKRLQIHADAASLIIVASVHSVHDRIGQANARLIAAAPEMLAEILAALAEHAAEQHMGGDCPCEVCERRRALLARIEATP